MARTVQSYPSTVPLSPWGNTLTWVDSSPPPTQSPAEVLDLLGPSAKATQDAKAAAFGHGPLAYTAGRSNFHETFPDNCPGRFSKWRLDEVGASEECSNEVLGRLEAANKAERSQLVAWLLEAILPLAHSRCGCRVVQKALELAGSTDRDKLVARLEPFAQELYICPNGNHVLSKVVEVMPATTIGSLIAKFVGQAVVVAKHRYGCRVLERLIEHCDESQIGVLMDEIVPESKDLCRHQYANFVIQHLIEHSAAYCTQILDSMLDDLPIAAVCRYGSHVVQKLMDFSPEERKADIVAALLHGKSPNALIEVASDRYGSYVVEQLAGMTGAGSDVTESVTKACGELSQSRWGLKVLQSCGVAPFEEALSSRL